MFGCIGCASRKLSTLQDGCRGASFLSQCEVKTCKPILPYCYHGQDCVGRGESGSAGCASDAARSAWKAQSKYRSGQQYIAKSLLDAAWS